MSLTTALDLEFADGAYLFDLELPQLAELQEKRGPIFEVYGRVLQGRYLYDGMPVADTMAGKAYAEDLFETIRLGLIGGGKGLVGGKEVDVNALTAKTLVERYCHTAPLKESWAIAAVILAARIEGYSPKDEPAQAPAAPKPKRQRKKSTSSKS